VSERCASPKPFIWKELSQKTAFWPARYRVMVSCMMNQDSVFDIVTRLLPEWTRYLYSIPGKGNRFFLSSKMSRPAFELTQPSCQCVPKGFFPPGVKVATNVNLATHFHQIPSLCQAIFPLPTRLYGLHRDSFTLPLLLCMYIYMHYASSHLYSFVE
jgi:hypothetical protein